ncbi:MAG: dual specificity protein phosphatase family protein [Armatimonadetes bacterium]|nr:dual specificity protein phosphatase family protein [Armatimonadota bacterium]
MDFHWAVENELATGSLPSTEGDVRLLERMGIRAVLSLHPVSGNIQALFRQAEIEHRFRRLEDMTSPGLRLMEEMDGLLERWRAEGKPALVHCYMGVGRCRTVACAHLAARLQDLERAFTWVGLPQTEAQREFVRVYFHNRNRSRQG